VRFFARGDAGRFLALGVVGLLLALLITSGRARFGLPAGAAMFLGVVAAVAFLLATLAGQTEPASRRNGTLRRA
jgi:hypothetical protein